MGMYSIFKAAFPEDAIVNLSGLSDEALDYFYNKGGYEMFLKENRGNSELEKRISLKRFGEAVSGGKILAYLDDEATRCWYNLFLNVDAEHAFLMFEYEEYTPFLFEKNPQNYGAYIDGQNGYIKTHLDKRAVQNVFLRIAQDCHAAYYTRDDNEGFIFDTKAFLDAFEEGTVPLKSNKIESTGYMDGQGGHPSCCVQ